MIEFQSRILSVDYWLLRETNRTKLKNLRLQITFIIAVSVINDIRDFVIVCM